MNWKKKEKEANSASFLPWFCGKILVELNSSSYCEAAEYCTPVDILVAQLWLRAKNKILLGRGIRRVVFRESSQSRGFARDNLCVDVANIDFEPNELSFEHFCDKFGSIITANICWHPMFSGIL